MEWSCEKRCDVRCSVSGLGRLAGTAAAAGLREGDVPWDQHVLAAEDFETTEGLRAEDVLEGLTAPTPLTELGETSGRGLLRDVFTQPAQFGGCLLEGPAFLEEDGEQRVLCKCGAEK